MQLVTTVMMMIMMIMIMMILLLLLIMMMMMEMSNARSKLKNQVMEYFNYHNLKLHRKNIIKQ